MADQPNFEKLGLSRSLSIAKEEPMRPTRLWTALMLSGMLLPSTVMAQKATYTAPSGPTEIRPSASSNPYQRPADHPAAMGMGGMMPPGHGMMPPGPSPYGHPAMQASYNGQMGPGPGPMMMDPMGYQPGYEVGPGMAGCENCGPGGCNHCSGLIGFGILG
jgi:hypothetical protein